MTDDAKELLALADYLRHQNEYHSNSICAADPIIKNHIADLKRWEDLTRLSARQQASVESSAGRAVIDDDAVVIRFPLDALQSAMDGAWALRALDTRYKITNIDEFAQEFARALNREDEQGTTAIHKMADRAFVDCIENGAFGIEEHEQQDI